MQYCIFMSLSFSSISAVSQWTIPYKNNRNISSFNTNGWSPPQEEKGKILCKKIFAIGSMFWSLQIIMHCYSGTSDISWALYTSGNVMWHSTVVRYWCFRPTYWSHLQASSSHVMLKSRFSLPIMVCSNVLYYFSTSLSELKNTKMTSL